MADRATVRVYFTRGNGLAAAPRTVASTTVAAAFRALLAGPSAADRALGDTTAIPAGTALGGVQIAGRVATVDLGPSFASAVSVATQMRARVAQVVFTATQFPGVDRVAFAIDGKPARTLGPQGFMVDPPLSRLDLTEALDTVLTDTPLPGAAVTSPMAVAGLSDTFEAHVSLRLLDAHGRVLADTATDATSGNGVWGTFATQITFATPTTTTGTLEVFDPSEGDRAAAHGQTIPVRFG